MLFYFFVFLCSTFSLLSALPSVIIIGAGPSGIAAATKLLENGITNISILEAENRIGGRIHSVDIKDGYVDLGAEFCVGKTTSVVYQAVKNLNLLQYQENITKINLYYSNGSKINNDFALSLLKFLLEYPNVVRNTKGNSSSVEDKYLKWYNNTFVGKDQNNKYSFKIVKDAINLNALIVSKEGPFNWCEVKADENDKDCEESRFMTWKTGGYHTILNVLMTKNLLSSKTPSINDKFLFNKTVTEIKWSKSIVEVRTSNQEVYSADHVIFTPSLGVLQSKTITFDPSLPKEKLEAIDALRFKTIMKIILHFPDPWWNNNFLFLWSEEDLKKSAETFTFGYNKNGVSWITSIYALAKSPSNPNVLIAWVTDDTNMIPEIEKLSDDIIQKGIMFVVRKFLSQDYNITEPDSILRSRWYFNSNFRGSYSYKKSQTVSHNTLLAKPLTHNEKPILQFAGEATNSVNYGSVHGAIETGWREAQRILDFYKK